MPLSIEEEEEVIFHLEEIDNTFSSINRTLKEIKKKVENIKENNKNMGENMKAFTLFYQVTEEFDQGGTNQEVTDQARTNQEVTERISHQSSITYQSSNTSLIEADSSIITKVSSPGNPFINPSTSSDIINRSLLNVKSDSSTLDLKTLSYHTDDEDSDLVPFDTQNIPPIFQQEESLADIYSFIKTRKRVRREEILEEFGDINEEKMNILMDFLSRKKFIRKEGKYYSV